MILEKQTFVKLLTYAILGFGFYYAIVFFGILGNSFLFKLVALTFFLVTIPLPSALMNNKKLFPELTKRGKYALAFISTLLIFHHFLLSFIVVLLMPDHGIG